MRMWAHAHYLLLFLLKTANENWQLLQNILLCTREQQRKFALPSHYGIWTWTTGRGTRTFWSWLHWVIMVYSTGAVCVPAPRSEVDSTESLWYMTRRPNRSEWTVLKLTPPSHYGIPFCKGLNCATPFWSWLHRVIMVYGYYHSAKPAWVLKLTPPSHYGIKEAFTKIWDAMFWSWLHRVIMV